MLSVCAIGALVRSAILVEHLYRNPFAYAPITDGAVYWDWAGRLAGGEWLGQTPFVSAPLYPYLLGLMRALGGGLATVYVIQLVLDVLTAGALAWIGRARFGATVGLVAAIAWLVIDEPAFYVTRVLNSSLQVFGVVALWMLLIRWQSRPAWPNAAGIGAVLGLNCLANPAMLALLPIVPAWMIVRTRQHRRDAGAEAPAADAVGPD